MFRSRKAQLMQLEFKYFIYGFIIGLVAAIVLVMLNKNGVLPFTIPFI